MKKAVVLISGGMDSAVALYVAKKRYKCRALAFRYGQKASRETACAERIAKEAGVPLTVLKINLPWKGSALLDRKLSIPDDVKGKTGRIPLTYVPARNIIFLSYAVSFAEAIGAQAVFIGAHEQDFSNYPDCRSLFFKKYREMIKAGTRGGTRGRSVRIETPLIGKGKKEIVLAGMKLGVPFLYTWSCYRGGKRPCGICESCVFRAKGFKDAGIKDPLVNI